MRQHHTTFAIIWITGLFIEPSWLLAKTGAKSTPESTPLPPLTVRVYGFSAMSLRTLAVAESEAARILRTASLKPTWVNCVPPMPPGPCLSGESGIDLTLRVLANAPSQVSSQALGMASCSRGAAGALIFYDRILALRTYERMLPLMLGRVFAHEIVHLLLPMDPHSDRGLMNGLWGTDDLKATNGNAWDFPRAVDSCYIIRNAPTGNSNQV